MSRNPPLFGDVLSAEEHVLGCMCDSFRSPLEQNKINKGNSFSSINDQYPWKREKRSILSFYCVVYEIYGFHWCKSNHFNLELRMRKNYSLVTRGYSLSRGNSISKDEILCFYSCKNGLRGSATQLIFIIKYRYCIGGSRCERPITR